MKIATNTRNACRRRWLAASLLALSAAAHADLVLEDENAAVWRAPAVVAEASGPQPAPTSEPLRTVMPSGSTLPTTIETSLWQFVATVRAQQQGRPLEQLETRLKIVEAASGDVSPVPLPGAAWFLVMGLLGLAGVRLGGSRRETMAL